MAKKTTIKSFLKSISRQYLIAGALILACVVLGATSLFIIQKPVQQAKNIATTSTAKDGTEKTPTSPTSESLEKQPATSTTQETTSSTNQTTKPSTSTKPATSQDYRPTTTPQPAAATPFKITSIYLDQPAVYCSGGGDYYIVQIGDVDMYLSSPSGGSISYGFEVTGGIEDQWHGYQQQGAVAAGAFSTSANQLYGSSPRMAFSQTIWSGHGPAAVRAVVYSPNLIYSQWVTIPAQSVGQKCS